jgi:hypothetical protein
MQDDEAFDRCLAMASANGQPMYTGMRLINGDLCLHDETGRFPDKPAGCRQRWREEVEARRLSEKLARLGAVEEKTEKPTRESILAFMCDNRDADDPESVHADLDRLLLAYVDDEEITAAFEEMTLWYS